MEKFINELKKYKWAIIAGIVISLGAGFVTANMHSINFMIYKMQGDSEKMVTLLEEDIKNPARQDDQYFIKGVDYLLQNMNEEIKVFFESHFEAFDTNLQAKIIAGYNKKNLSFSNQKTVFPVIIEGIDNEVYGAYLKRMDPNVLDEVLAFYYQDQTEVNEDFIKSLYQIISIYPQRLVLDKFQFDLYRLLSMEGIDEQKEAIFNKVNPEKAKAMIFTALKTVPMDGDDLKTLMDFLNAHGILEGKEYTSFNTIYSEIYLIRKQYSTLDGREVDLNNKKEEVDLKINDQLTKLEAKKTQVNELTNEISQIENKLTQLVDYTYMALYIEKAYGNGEYEASIPKKNIFNNYKPSSQKFIVKLTRSEFSTAGLYYLDIYNEGTKLSQSGHEYPYYIEVSEEQISEITQLQGQRETKVSALETAKNEVSNLQAEVQQIKSQFNYSEIIDSLKEVQEERTSLAKRLEEKTVEIKNLLGMGEVTVSLEGKSQ